jgi:hypothetical protein
MAMQMTLPCFTLYRDQQQTYLKAGLFEHLKYHDSRHERSLQYPKKVMIPVDAIMMVGFQRFAPPRRTEP